MIDLPATLILDFPTIDALAEELVRRMSKRTFGGAPAESQPPEGKEVANSSTAPDQPNIPTHAQPSPSRAPEPDKPQPTKNKNGPRLTRPGYFTVPSIGRLQNLADEELQAVPRLVIGREGFGEISFLYPGECRPITGHETILHFARLLASKFVVCFALATACPLLLKDVDGSIAEHTPSRMMQSTF